MQTIKLTDGCPNGCEYCHEPNVKFQTYPCPVITDKEVQIIDMNLLANPDHLNILRSLPKAKYELVCGIDYRRLTPEIASILKAKGFKKIRWAWDYSLGDQKKHQATYRLLLDAGFKPYQLMVFIIVNWKIPFKDCMRKLDSLKIWNLEVSDCCFDGGYQVALHGGCTLYWTLEQIKRFRRESRKHNQMINFGGIDPEYGKMSQSLK